MLGRLEEVPAQCIGCIVYSDSESHDEYPLFCCETLQGTVYWLCRQSRNPRHYAPGTMHTLYRDNRTGVYMLSPGKFAPVQMLLSLIPLWFVSIFTLSFLTMMVAAVVCTVQGFMSL